MDRMYVSPVEAAKCVAREVPELDKDGKPTGKTERTPVKADEVLSCRVYAERGEIVVVTTAGEKLTGEATKQMLAAAEKAATEAGDATEGAGK